MGDVFNHKRHPDLTGEFRWVHGLKKLNFGNIRISYRYLSIIYEEGVKNERSWQGGCMADIVYFYPHGHRAHFQPGHPERPDRVQRIRRGLKEIDRWEDFPQLEPVDMEDELLESVHRPAYLDRLQKACSQRQPMDLDTYTTQESWQLALNAAGGGIAVADAVWERSSKVGFALTRPPGHHATADRAMGFCLLNNIALAAQYLIQRKGAHRIAILDFDLHHGNGTQDIFYDRGDVFYLSTHQSPFYPGTGHIEDTGRGEGEGKTVNVPLPAGSGDSAFQAVSEEIIPPFLDEFSPQMILVSYGFDTHWRDPLGGFRLSAAVYAEIIGRLHRYARERCQGRMALFLEGGYDLSAGEACSQGIVKTMLGELWTDPLGKSPQPERDDWKAVLERVKGKWALLTGN